MKNDRSIRTRVGVLALATLTHFSSLAAPPSEKRGWIGLGYQYHRAETAPAWLYVQKVTPGGPAHRAGFRPQDIITSIDGRPVPTERDVLTLFVQLVTGRNLTFTVLRQHRTLSIRVTAVPLPPDRLEIWQRNNELLARMAKQQRQ